MKVLKTAILCGSVFVLVACASNPERQAEKSAPSIGNAVVYAKLTSTPGGYRFSDISFAKPSNSTDAWVVLNSLNPAFETKPEKNCFIGTALLIGPDKGKNCSTINEAQFRSTSMGTFQAIAKGVTTAITYGMTGTSRMVDVTFDRAAYDAAVSQADAALAVPRSEILQEVDAGVVRLYASGDAYKADGAKVQTKLSVVDESGFLNDGDIDFKKMVVLRYASIPAFESVPGIQLDASVSRDRIRRQFKDVIDKANLEGFSNFAVRCADNYAKGFRFTMTCPSAVQRKVGGVAELPVQVKVTGRDFVSVRPKAFSASDKNLRATLEGDRLVITNLTQSYIKVEAISFYYQTKISTKQGDAISLPPLGENDSVRFFSFTHLLPSMDRTGITKQSRKASTVQFGLAIKYSVQGAGDFTLYKDQVIPELDLLTAPKGG
jgi:hypothetical protein